MKKIALTLLISILYILTGSGQVSTQIVRGTITDIDSKLPLTGVTVVIVGHEPFTGTVTDANGKFRFANIPIGRITIKLSSVGYETLTIPDIIVNSGKEVVLDLDMEESIYILDEVVVKPTSNDRPLNEMALVSSRLISVEETKRFSGSWDDPSRLLNNYAGIAATPNGNNDIIVRGNSPKYVQWRLDGVPITAPNHQLDQNTAIAGFSCLNNKLLSASDFFTAAYPAEYGNVLSGIYDVKLRTGNNEKFETMLGAGLLGTDFTVEGPFKKGYGGSYLINYRFSNIGILQKVDLIDNIDGVRTTFQDANFKVVLPTKKMGIITFFGVIGLDNLEVDDLDPDTWITPGNDFMNPDLKQDFYKKNYLANIGMSQLFHINNKSYIKSSSIISATGMNDDVYESNINKSESRMLNYSSRIRSLSYTEEIKYSNKLNTKNLLQLGISYSFIKEKNNQSETLDTLQQRFTLVDYKGDINLLQSYISWKHILSEQFSIVLGLHNSNVLLNNKSTIEPRVAANWKINYANTINIGYGKHSTMEGIHNYFVRTQQSDGSIIEPNKNLDLLKSDHFVLGYSRNIAKYLTMRIETYYQRLYNLPVENDHTSYYSTINEGSDYKFVALVNEGTGKNYGIEFTIEKYFSNNYYFLINGSLFDSKYKALDGVERNTKFNSNYLINILGGVEFDKLGKKKNQTFNINSKLFFSGGQRYTPLLRDSNGDLAVNPQENKFWDYSKAYVDRLEKIYQINLSFSYKFNRERFTHELFFDLPNITNNRAKLTEFYDASEPDKIGYTYQIGLIPNFMYRLCF